MFTLRISLFFMMATVAFGLECPFQSGSMKSDRVQTVLSVALTKLAANGGPKYTIDNITSGYAYGNCWFAGRYEINASLKDAALKSHTCNIIIWKNNWRSVDNSVTTVIFACKDEPEVVGTYNDTL